MSKPFKRISNTIEYFLLLFLQMIVRIIPRRIALAMGGYLGTTLYYAGFYRKVVRINLEHVALWNNHEMEQITRALYKNIGRYAVDFLRPVYPLPRHKTHGFDMVDDAISQGKGTIAILGHLGNWEMLAAVFGKRTGRLHVVAQPMSNSIVDKWIFAKRTKASVQTIYTGHALRKMIEVIKKDGIIAILIDQSSRVHGTEAPFLGKKAKTVRTVAGLCVKTGCNVVSTNAIMRSDGNYNLHFITFQPPDSTGLTSDEAITICQKQHNDIISEQILAYPEHWFGWFHRRFHGYANYRKYDSSK